MAVLNSQRSNDNTSTPVPMSQLQVNTIHLDEVKLETTDGINATREYSKKKQPENIGSMKGTKGKASKFRERAYSTRSDASSMSGMKDVCRICHWYAEARGTDNQVEELIFPCACLYAGVHQRCIYKWASKMKSNVCEVCDQKFDPKYVPEIKQPYINWNFVPSYTRRRSIIASIILTFLVAITVITSYLLVKTLMKGENIKDSMHIVWPLIAVVSICCMGLICFVTWFFVFCRETVKEYSEASKKHMRRIEEA